MKPIPELIPGAIVEFMLNSAMTDDGSDSGFNTLYFKTKEFDFIKVRVLNRH